MRWKFNWFRNGNHTVTLRERYCATICPNIKKFHQKIWLFYRSLLTGKLLRLIGLADWMRYKSRNYNFSLSLSPLSASLSSLYSHAFSFWFCFVSVIRSIRCRLAWTLRNEDVADVVFSTTQIDGRFFCFSFASFVIIIFLCRREWTVIMREWR